MTQDGLRKNDPTFIELKLTPIQREILQRVHQDGRAYPVRQKQAFSSQNYADGRHSVAGLTRSIGILKERGMLGDNNDKLTNKGRLALGLKVDDVTCPNCEFKFVGDEATFFVLKGFYLCPGCERFGCDNCLPGGRGCLCPECEEGGGSR